MSAPSKWRKRPVVIEAWPLTRANVHEVARWCGGRVIEEVSPRDHTDVYLALDIPTLEGVMRAPTCDPSGRFPHGSVVIRGVAGEFYRCAPEIFAESYESAEGDR